MLTEETLHNHILTSLWETIYMYSNYKMISCPCILIAARLSHVNCSELQVNNNNEKSKQRRDHVSQQYKFNYRFTVRSGREGSKSESSSPMHRGKNRFTEPGKAFCLCFNTLQTNQKLYTQKYRAWLLRRHNPDFRITSILIQQSKKREKKNKNGIEER